MRKGLLALSPLMVFITLYLVTSIVARDFYKVPITVAFLTASIYAIAITKGKLIRRIKLWRKLRPVRRYLLFIYKAIV